MGQTQRSACYRHQLILSSKQPCQLSVISLIYSSETLGLRWATCPRSPCCYVKCQGFTPVQSDSQSVSQVCHTLPFGPHCLWRQIRGTGRKETRRFLDQTRFQIVKFENLRMLYDTVGKNIQVRLKGKKGKLRKKYARLCYKLNCVPPKFMCKSPRSQYLRMGCIWRDGF